MIAEDENSSTGVTSLLTTEHRIVVMLPSIEGVYVNRLVTTLLH